MPTRTDSSEAFAPRHVETWLRAALPATLIDTIVGVRKPRLTCRITKSEGRTFVTLNDTQSKHFAQNDPTDIMHNQQVAVINEVPAGARACSRTQIDR